MVGGLPLGEASGHLVEQQVRKTLLTTLRPVVVDDLRLGQPKHPGNERSRAVIFIEPAGGRESHLLDDVLGILELVHGRKHVGVHGLLGLHPQLGEPFTEFACVCVVHASMPPRFTKC